MYILGIDQGTTGTTCGLFCLDSLSLIATANVEFNQVFSSIDRVEHNLIDIWQSVEDAFSLLMSKTSILPSQIATIGITNQRETVCAFDQEGRALANAIVWQDKRTNIECKKLADLYGQEFIVKKTGLPFDPYFSATKFKWLIENNEKVKVAANSRMLKLGNIDTYLVYKLTSGATFKTDVSNASRTQLMDLETGSWSEELCSIFGVSKEFLPEITDSIGPVGLTKGVGFLPDGIPICAIMGDQQASLFGLGGCKKGDVKTTYGTGAFTLVNTGKSIFRSRQGLLTTIAYGYKGELYYGLEGSCYTAGAAVQWLRDQFNFFNSSDEIESLALSAKNEDIMDLFCFPFLSGIGSPHWKPDAKALILGMTRAVTRSELCRVVLEGIALSVNELINAFRKDFGDNLLRMKVDGGASKNNLLMQMQASFTDIEIERTQSHESTCLGACIAAAIGAELASFDILESAGVSQEVVKPVATSYYEKKKNEWRRLLSLYYLNN